jgi:type I restriction enzyme R subunit
VTEAPSSSHSYEPIALNPQSTVVAQFVPDPSGETRYQSEAELEQALLDLLKGQAYEYLRIASAADLEANLRGQLEALNGLEFADEEWQRFFVERIAGLNDRIVEKTARIQEDHVQLLRRADGTVKNVYLLDKQNIHNNRLQVINQYEVAGARSNRYDVTILVNGLPLVHVELKRRGVDIREAFNQINRYQRDSFWADSGLFEYVQLFVISNGTLTKYYSNTTRDQHVGEQSDGKRSRRRKTSTSFEFTSWWADASNKPITDLVGFTKTFLSRHTLMNILTKYCVFDVDRKLLVMRPYQIVATEQILRRVEIATNYKKLGSLEAGGYVWHTTGSGKTLTSFKTAQLATKLSVIDKVLFVVDRKDLDYQTMREYERFEKGAANSNASTRVLRKQLEDPNARIIITTIQKLSRFIAANPGHEIYGGHVVVIFDECHRSQFGDMHDAITKAFRRYHLFGFTGTPIFAENAPTGGKRILRTTEQAFGERLHTYTIVDAISDKNVLPFRIDYINTVRTGDAVVDKQVSAIDTERALLAPERVGLIVDYVLGHFDQKTRRAKHYRLGEKRVSGFNALFATASIEAAKRYHNAFFVAQEKRLMADTSYQPLKIALIYSYAPNEDAEDGLLAEEEFELGGLDQSSEAFLRDAIYDYNDEFGTSFDTDSERFQNYYKDVSMRLKSRELDMLIVVNMFLTGFDATTLNTLWVDKGLRQHGLIQAFSRTNRILNSVKTYGNIVSFRDLERETNDALALFGNKDAKGIVLLRPFGEYYAEYEERLSELVERYPLGDPITGEAGQKHFVRLFGQILRLRNILVSFDDFAGRETLAARELQDYQSLYLDLFAEFRKETAADKEPINDDLVFEIELIKQIEVNVDYVLLLVRRYLDEGGGKDKEIRATIDRAVDSSPSLRNKKDLIDHFVDSLTVDAAVDEEWRAFVDARRSEDLDRIITEEGLDAETTRAFIANAFRDAALPKGGTAITRVLPPASRFSKSSDHATKKHQVLIKLGEFFERYFGLS